jgi:hypothetical protein
VDERRVGSENADVRDRRSTAGDVEVFQNPTEQQYGRRDCAGRDPAGNLIDHINQLR